MAMKLAIVCVATAATVLESAPHRPTEDLHETDFPDLDALHDLVPPASPVQQYAQNFAAHEEAAKELLRSDEARSHGMPKLDDAVRGVHAKLAELMSHLPHEAPSGALDAAARFHHVADAMGLVSEAEKAGAMKDHTAAIHTVHDKLAAMEQNVLAKLGTSVQMMVKLHAMMKPIAHKLEEALLTMPEGAKARAEEILGHIHALDALSSKAVVLAQNVEAAKSGSDAEKTAAIARMIEGMKVIKDGVTLHLGALREAQPRKQTLTQKLHSMLVKTAVRIAKNQQNPKLAKTPMAKLDHAMFDTLKTAYAKSKALMIVAKNALDQAKDETEKAAVKEFTTAGMKKLLTDMKSDLQKLKMKAVLVSVTKLNEKMQAKHEAHDDEQSLPSEDIPDNALMVPPAHADGAEHAEEAEHAEHADEAEHAEEEAPANAAAGAPGDAAAGAPSDAGAQSDEGEEDAFEGKPVKRHGALGKMKDALQALQDLAPAHAEKQPVDEAQHVDEAEDADEAETRAKDEDADASSLAQVKHGAGHLREAERAAKL